MRHEGSMQLTLEADSDTTPTLDAIINTGADTIERVVRVTATSGTNIWQVDLNGVTLESPEIFSDVDGVVTYDVTFTGQYAATLGDWINAAVTNSLAAVP